MITDFNQIADECSCPVYLKNADDGFSVGTYYDKRNFPRTSKIVIMSIGNKAENIVHLIHEKIHLEHETKNCKCMSLNKRTLAEYHAYKGGLQTALKLNDKNIIEETLLLISGQAETIGGNPHKIAAKKIMKLKLWQKALDFIMI